MSEQEVRELIRQEKNRYAREWRAKNPEKAAEAQRKWRQANPNKVKAAKQRYWEKKAMERLRATEEQKPEAQGGK